MGRLILRSSVTAGGGGFTDGQSISIGGSGWGTFSGTRLSMKDAVEAASNGTAIYSISALSSQGIIASDGLESSLPSSDRHQVSTASPLFGTKCILASSVSGDGRHGLGWNTGSTYSKIFTRDYCRVVATGSPTGQWKNIRYTYSDCLTDDDRTNNYWTTNFGAGIDAIISNEGSGCGIGGASGVEAAHTNETNVVFNVWYERETEMVFGTAGVTDGIARRRYRRTSDWTMIANDAYSNVMNFSSGNTTFRPSYLHWQDYQGNGLELASPPTDVKLDAVFAQVGSLKRVYISPQATHAAAQSTGPMELLDRVTGWADTLITGTLRQGIMSAGNMSGALYAYIYDDTGAVINTTGQPIS